MNSWFMGEVDFSSCQLQQQLHEIFQPWMVTMPYLWYFLAPIVC